MLIRAFSTCLLIAACLGVFVGRGSAETPASTSTDAPRQVEFFEAKKAGDIDVQFVALNDHAANILIKNNTKKPLAIKLPEAFAGAPVLAQNNNNNNRNNGGGGNNNNQQNQGLGGGGGGFGQGGGGGGGGGGGFFNLAPDKLTKIKVECVCLDHLKKNPNPGIKYEIMPISEYTSKPGVAELCAALGKGQIGHDAAQAAAWHLNSGVSWEELASKQLKHLNGNREPYFTQDEILSGMKAAQAAIEQAKKQPAAASPGESLNTPSAAAAK